MVSRRDRPDEYRTLSTAGHMVVVVLTLCWCFYMMSWQHSRDKGEKSLGTQCGTGDPEGRDEMRRGVVWSGDVVVE